MWQSIVRMYKCVYICPVYIMLVLMRIIINIYYHMHFVLIIVLSIYIQPMYTADPTLCRYANPVDADTLPSLIQSQIWMAMNP